MCVASQMKCVLVLYTWLNISPYFKTLCMASGNICFHPQDATCMFLHNNVISVSLLRDPQTRKEKFNPWIMAVTKIRTIERETEKQIDHERASEILLRKSKRFLLGEHGDSKQSNSDSAKKKFILPNLYYL